MLSFVDDACSALPCILLVDVTPLPVCPFVVACVCECDGEGTLPPLPVVAAVGGRTGVRIESRVTEGGALAGVSKRGDGVRRPQPQTKCFEVVDIEGGREWDVRERERMEFFRLDDVCTNNSRTQHTDNTHQREIHGWIECVRVRGVRFVLPCSVAV